MVETLYFLFARVLKLFNHLFDLSLDLQQVVIDGVLFLLVGVTQADSEVGQSRDQFLDKEEVDPESHLVVALNAGLVLESRDLYVAVGG